MNAILLKTLIDLQLNLKAAPKKNLFALTYFPSSIIYIENVSRLRIHPYSNYLLISLLFLTPSEAQSQFSRNRSSQSRNSTVFPRYRLTFLWQSLNEEHASNVHVCNGNLLNMRLFTHESSISSLQTIVKYIKLSGELITREYCILIFRFIFTCSITSTEVVRTDRSETPSTEWNDVYLSHLFDASAYL